MTSPTSPPVEPADEPVPLPDAERPATPVLDDEALPDHLDAPAEVPVPDFIDQRRSVVSDEDDIR